MNLSVKRAIASKTARVNQEEVNIPPMIAMAGIRWNSEPVPRPDIELLMLTSKINKKH